MRRYVLVKLNRIPGVVKRTRDLLDILKLPTPDGHVPRARLTGEGMHTVAEAVSGDY